MNEVVQWMPEGFKSYPEELEKKQATQDFPLTDFQKRSMAANWEHRLYQAITARGEELGLDAGEILEAMEHASAEIRFRGWGYDQMPYGNPVDDFVLYGL